MSDDPYGSTFRGTMRRLLDREGRRASDQIIGWVRLVREVVLVLVLVWIGLTGGDVSQFF